ncbi:MAG: hypothetical protein KGH53_01780 [Candidatus Micrarchaeota archaeon]|nr:hypothetical protein [Candidatus Micrarchaeota archaeon]
MRSLPIYLLILFSLLLSITVQAQYNYCGSFATNCQVASIASCPQYCTPQQDLSKCPTNYVVCVQTSNPNLTPSLSEQLCKIYSLIREVLYALSLLLFVLGGVIYAIAHAIPPPQKGSYQGYGIGLVLGAITVALLAVLAPIIINLILGNSMGTAIPTC